MSESLKADVRKLREIVFDLREELEEERQKRRDLENDIETLLDVSDMLKNVQQNGSSDWDAYAAVILRSLGQDARKHDDLQAEMTARECWNLLQRQPHRTNCLDILRRAADLVDDEDVANVVKEDRSSSKNSRLVIDLSEGELPGQVAGHDVTGGVSA